MGRKGWIVRLAMAGLVLAVAALTASEAAGQDALPPSLAGERLQNLHQPLDAVEFSCNPEGESTFSYTASGVATGPYPGTFLRPAGGRSGRRRWTRRPSAGKC